jgi:hypothetical protein
MRDDIAMDGKPFIVLSTNGDLITNPMRLSECMVCGGVFTREQSRKHSEVRCQPSPEQPLAAAGRYRMPHKSRKRDEVNGHHQQSRREDRVVDQRGLK